MSIEVQTSYLYTAEEQVVDFASDVNKATDYTARHLESFNTANTGIIFSRVLAAHADYVKTIQQTHAAAKNLLTETSFALHDAAKRYDDSEDDAFTAVKDLFADLDPTQSASPIGADDTKTSAGLAAPSILLTDPESKLDDPAFKIIWQIMNWPDYFSLTYWGRTVINAVTGVIASDILGCDIFEWVENHLGGNWEQLALAGDAYGRLGDYYVGLSECVNDAGVEMFTGWPSGAGAEAAGMFFAEMTNAFASQQEAFAALEEKYTDAAWSAFFAYSAMFSAFDAAIDAIIAAQLSGLSVAQILGSLVTAGALLPGATVDAIVAAVEAIQASWGWAMVAGSSFASLGGLLGAITTQIEFVSLPEA